MKDILFINMFSKNESPYMDHYLDVLDSEGATYDIVYFERYDMSYTPAKNEFVFKHYFPTGGKKYKKLGVFLKYVSYVRKLIKRKEYYGVIVLTTLPAVVLFDKLIKKYKKHYLLDIRDYTHEKNKAYYQIEKAVIKNSFSTIISSKGFKKFLPRGFNYIPTHNVPVVLPEAILNRDDNRNHPYTIGFVGSIRYYNENVQLINQLKDSDKYCLDYYGTFTKGCDLEAYCNMEEVNNVTFHGPFHNEEKADIYMNVDIVNSIYGDNGLETSTAVPNRLYDACIYGCPIIVSKGTYLSDVVNYYSLGVAVDIYNDDVKQILDDYLLKIDWSTFYNNCYRFMSEVKDDMLAFQNEVRHFVREGLKKSTRL